MICGLNCNSVQTNNEDTSMSDRRQFLKTAALGAAAASL